MNTLVVQIYQSANTKYHKFRGRLNKNIANGRFHRFTKRKQSQLLGKLERLRNRLFYLQTQLKLGAAGAAFSLLLSVSPANAQTSLGPFTRNYLDNPLPPPLPYVYRPTLVYADLDGDSDLDLIVGGDLPGLKYFENVGTKSKPQFLERKSGQPQYPFGNISSAIPAAKRSYAPAFADIDNDGDLDLLVGTDEKYGYSTYGETYFFRNVGSGSAPNFSSEIGATNPFDGISTRRYAHPTFVDIDADGDTDLFLGGYYNSSTYHDVLQFFKNTGTPTNPVYVDGSSMYPLLDYGVVNGVQRNDNHDWSPISFADLDQDGDLDFFISLNGEVVYYRNDNGSFKIQYGYNGDATQVGPWIPNPGNPGSSLGNPFDAINNDLPGVDYVSFAFADLDDDGDLDVTVAYNENGYGYNIEKAFFYYENKGLGVFELKEGLDSPVDGVDLVDYSNVSFADIDGDGDLDALTSGSETYDYYVYYCGCTYSSTYSNQELYQNDNGKFSLINNPFSELGLYGDNDLKLFDLDKDGDLDLIAPFHVDDHYYSEARVRYFQNNAGVYTELTGPNNPFDFINETPNLEPDVDLGDLNGDGNPDLILSTTDSKLALFENIGTLANPVFSPKPEWETGISVAVIYINHPKFLDLDHDGDLDIIVGKYGGFWYYENIGSTTLPAFKVNGLLSDSNPFKGLEINISQFNINSPTFADLDNDGDQDLFSGDNSGQFSYFENTNPAPVTTVLPNLNFSNGVNPVVLDANLTVSDSDNDKIAKAEVTILNFRPGDEVLSFTPDEAIKGIFNATTGTLTLTGLDTNGNDSSLPIANFQSALRSVKYQFIGATPPSGGRLPSGRRSDITLDRSIIFAVLDQDFTTPGLATMAVQITFLSSNQAPVITPTTAQAVVGNSVSIDFTSLISDPNNNLDPTSFRVIQDPLSGASYTITGFIVNLDYAKLDFVGQDQFTIEICDLLGACTTSQITIDVAGDIIVYNGLSPNTDSYNSYFKIANINVLEPQNKVSIFNRWGSLVFEVDNYNNDTNRFEGKNNNGNELPSGTYFYKIGFTSGSGRETMTGYLTLKK
ncbi:MAG: VCBS repeat-containing protein [Cyclobacteriaceae bacterium]|nr:VCBS repeat-containing protein [Cyclobacteriaceae bacterium]